MISLQQHATEINYGGRNMPAGTYALVRRGNLERYELVAPAPVVTMTTVELRAQIVALVTDLENGTEGRALDERTRSQYTISLKLYASALNGCAAVATMRRAVELVNLVKAAVAS